MTSRLGLVAFVLVAAAGCSPNLPTASADVDVPEQSEVQSASHSTESTPGSADPKPLVVAGRMAFSSEASTGNEDVYSVELGRGGSSAAPVRLTTSEDKEFDPDISPDGRSIAFRLNPDVTSDHADIWVMAADGSGPSNLTNAPELDNWSPAWSPDGSRIAFASTRDGGTLSVWTMDGQGADVQRVTREHGEYPDWSPQGDRIVYAAPPSGSGRYDLWIVPADGAGEPVRLTDDPGTQFGPAWSPDGRWIAYQSEIGERWEVWIIRADGTGARRVTPEGEDGVWPAWSPAGLLAWSGPGGIHVADVDSGANQTLGVEDELLGPSFLSWTR
jgi:Tol biopolymer transport system component